MKHQSCDVLPIYAISISVEETQIRHEMLLVVVRQGPQRSEPDQNIEDRAVDSAWALPSIWGAPPAIVARQNGNFVK
jgi:hypothetical protein